MKDLKSVIELVYDSAKENSNADRDLRNNKDFKIGTHGRHGDIYIHRVNKDHKHGEITKNRQLAFGNSLGSRHIVEGDKVKLYRGTTPPDYAESDTFLGQFIHASDEFVITHPKHANIILPKGYYQITHQVDAITKKRVTD